MLNVTVLSVVVPDLSVKHLFQIVGLEHSDGIPEGEGAGHEDRQHQDRLQLQLEHEQAEDDV